MPYTPGETIILPEGQHGRRYSSAFRIHSGSGLSWASYGGRIAGAVGRSPSRAYGISSLSGEIALPKIRLGIDPVTLTVTPVDLNLSIKEILNSRAPSGGFSRWIVYFGNGTALAAALQGGANYLEPMSRITRGCGGQVAGTVDAAPVAAKSR